MTAPLVLASASQTRAGMLEAAGLSVLVEPARIDEEAIKASLRAEGAPPRDQADKLAELKALRVSGRRQALLVLGADQMLVCGGKAYDKPSDKFEAAAQLAELRGKPHELLSAAVIVRDAAPIWRHVGRARMHMRPFTDTFIEQYLEEMGDEVLETVGCYKLEGLGAQLFSRVDGDYFTALGLPLLEILGFLRAQGVLPE